MKESLSRAMGKNPEEQKSVTEEHISESFSPTTTT